MKTLIICLALCTPPPKTDGGERPAPLPSFDGTTCQFGEVSQAGALISIEGQTYRAWGVVRPDHVWLTWQVIGDVRTISSSYRLKDGNLVGSYTWDHDLPIILPSGEVQGRVAETLRLEKRGDK